MDVPGEEPRTPGYDNLSKEDQAGSNFSTRCSSVGSNDIRISKAEQEFTPTSTLFGGFGFNELDDESGRNTVSTDAITPALANLSINSDDVTGISGVAQKFSTTDLSEVIKSYSSTRIQSEDTSNVSQDSSDSSYTTNLGIELEWRENSHFRRKGFPQGPSDEDLRKEKERLLALKKEKGIRDDKYIIESLKQFKDEYLRNKHSYPTLEQLKKDKIENADLWQVKPMCKRESYDAVLKGRSTYHCEYNSKQTKNVFNRIDCLLVLIYKLLKHDMTVNIRLVQYAFPGLFVNTSEVEYALEYICRGIGCTRDSLNMFASGKGRVAGDISFKGINIGSYATYCQGGVTIESRDVARTITFDILGHETPLFILLVEKDTIFQRLVEEQIHKRFRCIIVTGCGMPDVAIRILLKKMQQKLNLPVVALVDHNPSGFKNFLTYLCGAENMAHDSLNMRTPDIKWLGLRPSDLKEYGIPDGKYKDQAGLATIMNKDFVKKNQKLGEELANMQSKVEVEGMMSNHLKYLTEIYLPLQLQRWKDWA
ncbi:hypothetical protein M0R45_028309 [Rubus argutus]|uniref:Topoisomerase 6 subunit A/Spo11 TOPRIM domain-containing protein n=1 Tax=Rubus argutus TaxID=59490 RepID=A0AAW1W705_RUBAR